MAFQKVSCIDLACRSLVINQIWSYGSRLDTFRMKEALQEVLNIYPILAGRMSADGILCNNAGVLWEEARCSGIRIKDVSRARLPGKRFYAEFDRKAADKGNFPLMSVKVTHLEDGTILNVKCSHFCTDGSSFYAMMENWASLTRREGLVSKPVYDDSAVRSALGNSQMYKILASYDMKAKSCLLEKEGMFRIRPVVMLRMVWQKLWRINKRLSAPVFVPNSRVDAIKEEASMFSGKRVGRNAVLSAITVGILRQRMYRQEADVSIVHTADHRGRIRSIGMNYTGNLSFTLRPTTVNVDLPAGQMAALIDADMKKMFDPAKEEQYFALYCTMIENKMPWLPFDINSTWCARPTTLVINNCLKFNIYGIDFGDGGPIFAWPLDFGDPVRFWPSPPEESGVYVYFTGSLVRYVPPVATLQD